MIQIVIFAFCGGFSPIHNSCQPWLHPHNSYKMIIPAMQNSSGKTILHFTPNRALLSATPIQAYQS